MRDNENKDHALKGVRAVIDDLRSHREKGLEEFPSFQALYDAVTDPLYEGELDWDGVMDAVANFIEEVIK